MQKGGVVARKQREFPEGVEDVSAKLDQDVKDGVFSLSLLSPPLQLFVSSPFPLTSVLGYFHCNFSTTFA
jgi:hypothetical protein